jgi:hypothetical protein
MKVYKLDIDFGPDGNSGFQWLVPHDDSIPEREVENSYFSGKPLGKIWKSFVVYPDKPKNRYGDFMYYDCQAFIIGPRARKIAATPLEMSGEFLPVIYEGKEKQEHFIYNVTTVLSVLDTKKTKWNGPKSMRDIKEYHFHANRFGEETIFKIPEDVSIFVLERTNDAEFDEEFRAIVMKNKLTGLVFEEVWSDGE